MQIKFQRTGFLKVRIIPDSVADLNSFIGFFVAKPDPFNDELIKRKNLNFFSKNFSGRIFSNYFWRKIAMKIFSQFFSLFE